MSSLELKVPPPIVALCFVLLMWLASKLMSPVEMSFGLRVGIASVLAAAGLAIGIAGVTSFRRARTTINPTKPTTTSSLVSGGVYRFTRNPMYLSLALHLLAWTAFLSSLLALLFVPLFMVYINRFQINPEERALLALFGGEYTAYQRTVRRWL